MAEMPDLQKQLDEMRKHFEETMQTAGTIVVAGLVVAVVLIGAGAFVWSKVKYQ